MTADGARPVLTAPITNFTAIDQVMKGDVIWDSISKLDFYMTDGSTLTGAVKDDETYAGNGGRRLLQLCISTAHPAGRSPATVP
jgi:hypothetical protein